jgi:hypothetical protein
MNMKNKKQLPEANVAHQYRLQQAKELLESIMCSSDGGKTWRPAYKLKKGSKNNYVSNPQNKKN